MYINKEKRMNSKRIFVAFLLLSVHVAHAQNTITEKVEISTDKYKVETNRFWSNWFISAGGGSQMYFGDHDRQMNFGERLSPALDISVGKWFTPGIGIRLMYSGLSVKGATQNGVHSTGKVYDASKWLMKQKFNFMDFHADIMLNLSHMLCGYDEQRLWSFIPYAGLGWMITNDSPKARELGVNLGIMNSFRLSSALDLNLDIRGIIVKDGFDGEIGGRKEEGVLVATLGLTYKFKQRGWNRSKTIVKYDNAAINELSERLNSMRAENARLQKAIDGGNKEEIETIIKKMEVAAPNLITFKIGMSELSNENRVNLGFLAKVIKSTDSEAIYTITGYADSGTGSVKLNERLSKERAFAVYDCLINEYGISASQLRMDHKGGVDNMFYDDPRLSRAVITRNE